jgi:hypothetical protein
VAVLQCKRKAKETEGKSGRKQFEEEDTKSLKYHTCSKVLDESLRVLYPITSRCPYRAFGRH